MKEFGKTRRFRAGGGLLLICLGLVASCRQGSSEPEDVRHDATVRAVEQVMPSVVNIATARVLTQTEEILRQFYGLSQPPSGEIPYSVGSGVIIDEEGDVLTSRHVLDRASRVAVKLWDGREFDCNPLAGTLDSDLALIRIRAPAGEKFRPINLAPNDDLLLGETVIAVGNPLGLGGSVTKGILSSKSRRLPMGKGPLDFRDWLQTDAAINEGNSGGPLINLRGEMIGLNEAVVTNQQNISFAIPVKQVQAAIADFFRPEIMNQIWFGARVRVANGSLYVDMAQPNSPAESAGIRLGDEIVKVNGQAPRDAIQFNRALCGIARNASLTAGVVVRRQGERLSFKVPMISFDDLFRDKLGLKLARSDDGLTLAITDVQPDSPAAQAQLQKGFFVVGMDQMQTWTLSQAADVLFTKKKGDHISLVAQVTVTNGPAVETRRGRVDLIVR